MSQADSISVDVAIGITDDGKVRLSWRAPLQFVDFDPQNAFAIGEHIARTAHKVRFPDDPMPDGSYIAAQVRARVTEDLRDRMVQRAAVMLHSLRQTPKSDGHIALQLVDAILGLASGKTA